MLETILKQVKWSIEIINTYTLKVLLRMREKIDVKSRDVKAVRDAKLRSVQPNRP